MNEFSAASVENPSVDVKENSTSHQNSLKEVNKKRVAKARITADFIRKLPEGIQYNEFGSSDCEEPRQISELDDIDDSEEFKEGDIVKVGKFTINIERVTKQQLISMRKYLPPAQYRLIKNRKTARLYRRKRKVERGDMQKTLDDLREENLYYKIRIEELERKLAEAERALAIGKEVESYATMSNMMAAQNMDPQKQENVDLSELIKNALRRGSVTSNFNNQ